MQQNAVQEYKDKAMTRFKELGRLDMGGVACLAITVVLIVLNLLLSLIAFSIDLIPSLPTFFAVSFLQSAADLARLLTPFALLLGGGLLLFGGPRRRSAIMRSYKVVMFIPGLIWEIIQMFRLDRAAYARRKNDRARKREQQGERWGLDIKRRVEEGMPQHEFEALLIEVEEQFEKDGEPAHEIEAILSNLEELHEESQQRNELVERRREARERRRAGLADPDEDEMDDADRAMLARMQQNTADTIQRQAEARESARQEDYQEALAHEDEQMRSDQRKAFREEREDRQKNRQENERMRNDQRRAMQEEREERERNRRERDRNR